MWTFVRTTRNSVCLPPGDRLMLLRQWHIGISAKNFWTVWNNLKSIVDHWNYILKYPVFSITHLHSSSTQYTTRGLTLSRVGNSILVTTTIVNRSRSLVINNRFTPDTWRYPREKILLTARSRFEKFPKETCHKLYKKVIDYSYWSLPTCVPRFEFIATILNDLTTFEHIFVPKFELQAVWS